MRKPRRQSLVKQWTAEEREEFERRVEELTKELQPHIDACRNCELITAADLAIVINARAGR